MVSMAQRIEELRNEKGMSRVDRTIINQAAQ